MLVPFYWWQFFYFTFIYIYIYILISGYLRKVIKSLKSQQVDWCRVCTRSTRTDSPVIYCLPSPSLAPPTQSAMQQLVRRAWCQSQCRTALPPLNIQKKLPRQLTQSANPWRQKRQTPWPCHAGPWHLLLLLLPPATFVVLRDQDQDVTAENWQQLHPAAAARTDLG